MSNVKEEDLDVITRAPGAMPPSVMMGLSEARELVVEHCVLLAPRWTALGDAAGHVLAELVHAREAVPGFTRSAMDGYAVRSSDVATVPARLRVVGTVLAGEDKGIVVRRGRAVRVMTGAPLPCGADAVCMLEHTETDYSGRVVLVKESAERGENVRYAGEDLEAGSEVFVPRTFLTPAHIGVFASLGIETVLAYPRPRVGVLSSGDELVETAGTLKRGQIRDSNRPALIAQLRRDDFDAVDLGVVPDDETTIASVIERAGSSCDAVIVSGGVGAGDRDPVKLVLWQLSNGAMRSVHVAVKPGKPFAFATMGETVLFGLPGNPVAALVSYELLVRPALRYMAGHENLDRPRLSAVAAADMYRKRDGRDHVVRVVVQARGDGRLQVRALREQGSHQLHSMAGANALAILPDGDGARAGECVEVLLLDTEHLTTGY